MNPKTLAQMAAEANGAQEPMQIAGKPADKCPYCGCAMFANGKRDGEHVDFRYVLCKKPRGCGRSFYSKQAKPTLVREITHESDETEQPSRTGQTNLTVYREAG